MTDKSILDALKSRARAPMDSAKNPAGLGEVFRDHSEWVDLMKHIHCNDIPWQLWARTYVGWLGPFAMSARVRRRGICRHAQVTGSLKPEIACRS